MAPATGCGGRCGGRLLITVLFLLCAIRAAAQDPPATGNSSVKTDIQISGHRTMESSQYKVDGNRSQFLSQNGVYILDTTLQQSGMIQFKGALGGNVRVSGRFEEMPYQEHVFFLDMVAPNWSARAGDFDTLFPGGELIRFRKNIRGLDATLGNTGDKLRTQVLFSQNKSEIETRTFHGRNIRGPYNLNSLAIIENSERVEIDGRVLSPGEYVMDYFLGEITFTRPVDPSEQVYVAYESALFLSQNTNSLAALSTQYQSPGKRFTTSVSYILESANNRTQQTVEQDTKTGTLAGLGAAGELNLGATRLVKYVESVEVDTGGGWINLTRGEDEAFTAAVDYRVDYYEGVITFNTASSNLAPLAASTPLRVTFSYYSPKYIETVLDEELRITGETEFILGRSRIYGGSENVRLFYDTSLIRTLEPDLDYTIDEQDNTILILKADAIPDAPSGRHLKISYEVAPDSVSSVFGADREMFDMDMVYRAGDNLTLNLELAQTKSDVAPKPIQVVEELVDTADGVDTEFALDHLAVDGSVEVFFNDTVNINNTLNRSSGYSIQKTGDTSSIVFRDPPPAGTTIIASYKYIAYAEDAVDVRTGHATRAGLDYQKGGTSVQVLYQPKQVYFAPINAHNDFEFERLEAQARQEVFQDAAVTASYQTWSNAEGFDTQTYLKTTDMAVSFDMQRDRLKTIHASFGALERRDNLDTHQVENSQVKNEFGLGYLAHSRTDTVLSTVFRMRDVDDKTGNTSARKSTGLELGLASRPAPNLILDYRWSRDRVDSDAPEAWGQSADFDMKTTSHFVDIRYTPLKYFALNTTYDTQKISDSREDVDDYTVTTLQSQFIVQPMGSLKNITVTARKDQSPDSYTGNNKSSTVTASMNYALTPSLFLMPSYVAVNSSYGEQSRSKNTIEGARVEYTHGGERGLSLSAEINRGHRNIENLSGTTTTTQDEDYIQRLVVGRWSLSGMLMMVSYDKSRTRRNHDVLDPIYHNTNLSAELKYDISSRLHFRFNITDEKNRTSLSTNKKTQVVELKYGINRMFDLFLNYENQDYMDMDDGDNNYRARIFKTELQATF